MNFISFPVDSTNIFPASNTKSGGQLVTEYNLRSREMVSTDSSIKYEVGPSFVHSMEDFYVSPQTSGGVIMNNSVLEIAEGRGVINGHYVQTLSPITIDLIEANKKLADQSRPLLKGSLAVGIRTFYATEATIAGSILVEDENDMLLGVQLVVLPETEMITPEDSPEDPNAVTADIVLAKFTFLNNTIGNIDNLKSKLQYLTTDRLKYMDDFTPENYIRKTGLNSKKLYAFAGKGSDPQTGYDTWEDVTDSMIIWDREPRTTSTQPSARQADFVAVHGGATEGNSGGVFLVLPHKQVYGMSNNGNPQYYQNRVLQVPSANYSTGTPGVVSTEYTNHIKELAQKVDDFRNSLNGSQVMYMDTRTVTTDLPPINDEYSWKIGDYIVVKNDEYVIGGADSTQSAPSTMYVILPGEVLTVQFVTSVDGNETTTPTIPGNIWGAELGYQEWYQSAGQSEPNTTNPEYYPEFFDAYNPPNGQPYNSLQRRYYDYFRIRYYRTPTEGSSIQYPFTDYYYGVATSGPKKWSDALMLTGSISLATETTIGGFYNVSTDATDYGYVMLDETGHLRLLDYELLRSGTLAYQLAEDITLPSGLDISDIQYYLSEYVNRRIAFPSQEQLSSAPSVINITIPIAATDDGGTLEINGIDSRFDTAVCLNFEGDAGSNVTINIRDCQKLMINPSIGDPTKGEGPVINVYRTNLRYDPTVFDYIKSCPRSSSTYGSFTGFSDLSIWYERINSTDPVLTVDGMTVGQIDSYIISADINYWKELYDPVVNDNDYMVALKSITFSSEGEIVGCEILVANNSTDNIVVGDKIIVGDVTLPQGSALIYPPSCLTKVLKVSGAFTSAYFSDNHWYVTDNTFSFLSGTYDATQTQSSVSGGQIAVHSVTSLVPSVLNPSITNIEAWETDSYHVFKGGAIS